MNNNLIPEARVDKNGVTAIKYVRPDKPESPAQRSMPVPTISAAPVPVEPETVAPDYDTVAFMNRSYPNRTDSVLMSPVDLVAYSDLLDYASKTDDEGMDKVWAMGQLIKAGNTGAVKTILNHIEEHETGPEYDHHGFVFDVWSNGCDAGIFEQGKDYSETTEGQKFFDFIVNVFAAIEYEQTMSEASNETIQEVAHIYYAMDGEVDIDGLSEYWEERGGPDGFLEYQDEHNATRVGVL